MALLLYPRSNLPRPFRWLCRFPYPCAHRQLWTDVTLRCQMGKTRSRSAAALYAHPWVCTGDWFHDLPQVPKPVVLGSHSWPSCIRRFHIRGFYQPRMVNVVVNVLEEKKNPRIVDLASSDLCCSRVRGASGQVWALHVHPPPPGIF